MTDLWADVRDRSYTKDDLADGETTRLWQDVKPLLADADALLAVVRAAQGLKQVWLDKGHGGQAEVEAHRKIYKALAALPKHLREEE